ncbi:MAG: pilin [Betaproteobacteria bacterium]|nr:pilin [Betaproteobacteria bacterium]
MPRWLRYSIYVAALGGIVAAVVIPARVKVPPERRAATVLYFATEDARTAIERNAGRTKSLTGAGKGVAIAPRKDEGIGDLDFEVTADGQITGHAREYKFKLFLTPEIKEGRVAWKCSGLPLDLLPSACRG